MGRFRNRGISDLKEIGNDECAVQWSVACVIIMVAMVIAPTVITYTYYLMTIVSLVLLLRLTLSTELCTSDVYDSYLEAFPMKCGNDCNEYKRWVTRKEK